MPKYGPKKVGNERFVREMLAEIEHKQQTIARTLGVDPEQVRNAQHAELRQWQEEMLEARRRRAEMLATQRDSATLRGSAIRSNLMGRIEGGYPQTVGQQQIDEYTRRHAAKMPPSTTPKSDGTVLEVEVEKSIVAGRALLWSTHHTPGKSRV